MKFYLPKFQIASLQPPQTKFQSKFGGLPWGLPREHWKRCQDCGRLMSLLAQLNHDPQALDLGGPENVLHLFQCQECYGFDSRHGNDATIMSMSDLEQRLTEIPAGEDLRGILEPSDDQLVGELWISNYQEMDDGIDAALVEDFYDLNRWQALPKSLLYTMFSSKWHTKMGGLPYWTGNGPQLTPLPGYEFLFQLDSPMIEGVPPEPDKVGCPVITTTYTGEGANLRIASQNVVHPSENCRKRNAPWSLLVDGNNPLGFSAEITNLGTDGTAYVFINRASTPPDVYWYWNR